MPSNLAIVVFGLGILGLCWLDRDERRTSRALYIPMTWFAIACSRMVSQWLSLGQTEFEDPEQYLEGSPLDRAIFMLLLACALAVLAGRGKRAGSLIARNWPLLLFFLYCLVSVTWSDFPFVAFKRWSKAVGNLAMVMVVLTDPQPQAAVRRFLTRTGFLLVGGSVLLIKYFSEYGRSYLAWLWTSVYVGVSNTKNGLGYVCLIGGLASVWCLLDALRTDSGRRRLRRVVAHGINLSMVGWLFYKADSATSLACFFIGTFILIVTVTPKGRRPAAIHAGMATLVACGIAGYFLFDAQSVVVDSFNRDSSLSGRTDLWVKVLEVARAPWLGTGFESFWLGERSEYFWKLIWWHPNQSHNGYIETYINLGWVGIGFLALTIVFGYRTAVIACSRDPQLGPIRLAFFVVALIYNLTEAAYKGLHPVWIVFMLAATARPLEARQEDTAPVEAPTDLPAIEPAVAPVRRFVLRKPGTKNILSPSREAAR